VQVGNAFPATTELKRRNEPALGGQWNPSTWETMKQVLGAAGEVPGPASGIQGAGKAFISPALMAKAQAGDPAAVSAVLRQLMPVVRKSAAPYQGGPLYDDAVQEGLRSALQNLKSWTSQEGGRNPRNFLAPKIRADIQANISNLQRPVELPDHILDLLNQASRKQQKNLAAHGRELSMDALASSLGVKKDVLIDAYRSKGGALPYFEEKAAPSMFGAAAPEIGPQESRIVSKSRGPQVPPQELAQETSALRQRLLDATKDLKMSPAESKYFKMLLEDPEKNADKIGKMLRVSQSPGDILNAHIEKVQGLARRSPTEGMGPLPGQGSALKPISGGSGGMTQYRGWQEGFGQVPGFHMYDLLEDIKDPRTGQVLHPKGSTVSPQTLDKYGIQYDKVPPPIGGGMGSPLGDALAQLRDKMAKAGGYNPSYKYRRMHRQSEYQPDPMTAMDFLLSDRAYPQAPGTTQGGMPFGGINIQKHPGDFLEQLKPNLPPVPKHTQ